MSKEKNLSPALGLILIAVGLFTAIGLFSYHPGDVGNARGPHAIFNYAGKLGAWFSLYLFLVVGYAAYAVPVFLAGEGIARLVPREGSPRPSWLKLIYEALMIASLSPLLNEFPKLAGGLGEQLEKMGSGGWWGSLVHTPLHSYLGEVGTRLVLVTVFVVSGALLTEMKPLIFLARCGRRAASFAASLFPSGRRVRVTPSSTRPAAVEAAPPTKAQLKARARAEAKAELLARRKEEEERLEQEREEARKLKERLEKERLAEEKLREKEARKREKELRRREKEEKEGSPERPPRKKRTPLPPVSAARSVVSADPGSSNYRLPSVDLLQTPPPLSERELEDNIEVNSRILESTLLDFGIEAKVVGAERGPAITRYELQPAPGVKVGRIKSLDKDIALAMKATSIRILAPIPGKAALGIEVPNSSTALVYMREMVESPEYRDTSNLLPLALGKDISGRAIVADLAAMPHLLIAGATGSGKTVCINSIIISLLFSRTPEEMKLIMVDPKKVEMASFGRLAHLLCPVITDSTKTSMALAWLVKEMEDRYDLCSKAGVRNIQSYNSRTTSGRGEEEGEKLPASMPYIVLLIDELADLMLAASNEIENAIARLAHLSRAVGIHMILATQRPSVDVITGVIKANFPARVSFKVAAKVDSRTVLDTGGADKLLGDGDLLFLPPGSDRMVRAQGTFCRDDEIDAVVGFVNSQGEPRFEEGVFQKGAKGEGGISLGGGDVFLESAIEVIKQTEQASVSVLQRKLKIGYSRAARIMDMLEEQGVVGPYQGTKAREILIDTYGGEDTGPDFDEEDDEDDD